MSSLRFLRRAFSTTSQSTAAAVAKSSYNHLYKERNLKRLVQQFKKYSEIDRFRCKNGIYEDAIRRLAAAKRFRWIEEILEGQKKYDDISKEGFAIRLISLYGKSGMFDNAWKVFDEMPERNCKRSVLSLNALLAACVNSKKFDKVEGLFEELPKKLSVEPDLVSYNTVIKAFCQMGSLDSAVSMLDEMQKKGVKPDVITFNTLLDRLYLNGRFHDGEKIWSQMAQKNVAPDVRSYNAKLLGLATEKRTKEAVELVEEIRIKEIKLDIFGLNALIRGFVNEGNLEEAKLWYSEIEKNNCSLDKLTFAILIPFLCEKGELGFAFDMCNEVFNKRRLVDESLLQLVVDGLVKESSLAEAKSLVELGKTNSFRRYSLKLPSEE